MVLKESLCTSITDVCLYMCLLIHLFNYIYEHLLCAMYYASCFAYITSFIGSSMLSLPLAQGISVVIPYFTETTSRIYGNDYPYELPGYYD